MIIGFEKIDTGRTEIFDAKNILTIRNGEDVLIRAITNNEIYFAAEGKEDWEYLSYGYGNINKKSLWRFLKTIKDAVLLKQSILIRFSEKEKRMELETYM